jgi:hypothetical protein
MVRHAAVCQSPRFHHWQCGQSPADVREPGIVNWDLSAIKNTRITESDDARIIQFGLKLLF